MMNIYSVKENRDFPSKLLRRPSICTYISSKNNKNGVFIIFYSHVIYSEKYHKIERFFLLITYASNNIK